MVLHAAREIKCGPERDPSLFHVEGVKTAGSLVVNAFSLGVIAGSLRIHVFSLGVTAGSLGTPVDHDGAHA